MARELKINVLVDQGQAKRELGETEKAVKGVEKATGDLDKQMANATGTMSKTSLVVAGLAAVFTVDKIIGFTREMLAFSGHMKDLSDRTGIGVERLQGLAIAADEGGVSIDGLASAMGILSRNLVEGSPNVVQALGLMHLNLKDLLALSPDQRLFEIARAFEAIEDPAMRAWASQQLFGRGGNEIIPLLTKNLEALTKQYEKSAIPKETIERADALEEAWKRLKTETAALTFTMGFSLVDAMSQVKLGQAELREETALLADDMDRALAGALKAVKDPAHLLGAETLPNLTMSMEDADRIAKELTATATASAKAHEEQARAVVKADAAYRQFINFVEERYIETIKLQIEVSEKQRDELNKLSQATDDYLGHLQKMNEETQRILDADEAAWRQHRNEIGQILMEQDRLILESNDRTRLSFAETAGMIGDTIDGVRDVFRDFNDDTRTVMDNVSSYFQGMQRGASGFMRVMAGDVTGWVDVIIGSFQQLMSFIRLLGAAWRGLQSLFGTDEEARSVNPKRDTFLSQWGDPSNKGVGGAGWNLAALLTGLGAGEGGGAIFNALQQADTMAMFRPAAQAIVEFLTAKGESASMNFGVGGMVPQTGMALVHGGEGVLTPRGVSAVGGPSGVDALNRGGSPDVVTELKSLKDVVGALATVLTQRAEEFPRASAQEAMLARGRRLAHV